ncbi:MAG TPA: PilN domain-containing protein [Stellaceae bacterium]|nr:PilN domain-containing protein [Stellaceae bacterium]
MPPADDIRASLNGVVAPARRFFHWWGGELAALMPDRLRELSRGRGQLVLALGETSEPLGIFAESSGALTPLARFTEAGAGNDAAAIGRILRRPEIARPIAHGQVALCLRLPARWALCRVIELPLAADENLAEVVGFELDRHTPFRAEQVYFSYRVLVRDVAAQSLRVEVTVVPRTIAESARQVARELGWAAERLDVAAAGSFEAQSGNLLASAAPESRLAQGRFSYFLAAAAAGLALVALVLPTAVAMREAATMADEVAAAAPQARAAAAIRRQIDALRASQDFLLDRKLRSPTISNLLAVITRLMPDDAWLSELRVRGTEVELSGVAASASGLIAVLEQSGKFRDTTFRSPVTPDPATGRERFSIAARLAEASRP